MLAYLSNLEFDNLELNKIINYYKEVFESLGMSPFEIEDIIFRVKISSLESFCDVSNINFSEYFESKLEESINEYFQDNGNDIDSAIDLYIKSKNEAFSYSREEEQEFFKKIKAGDKKARDDFILKNRWLVKLAIDALAPSIDCIEDYYQDGFCGLIKSVDGFDPTKNFNFSTYAFTNIKRAIFRGDKNVKFAFKLSCGDYLLVYKYNEFLEKFQREYGRVPNDSEVKLLFGISLKMIKILKREPYASSLDQLLSDEDSACDIESMLVDRNFMSQSEIVELEHRDADVRKIVDSSKLLPEQKEILRNYYKTEQTYTALAKQMGVTSQKARESVNGALRILRGTEGVLELIDYLDKPDVYKTLIKK